jgi:hypothetical protein
MTGRARLSVRGREGNWGGGFLGCCPGPAQGCYVSFFLLSFSISILSFVLFEKLILVCIEKIPIL